MDYFVCISVDYEYFNVWFNCKMPYSDISHRGMLKVKKLLSPDELI